MTPTGFWIAAESCVRNSIKEAIETTYMSANLSAENCSSFDSTVLAIFSQCLQDSLSTFGLSTVESKNLIRLLFSAVDPPVFNCQITPCVNGNCTSSGGGCFDFCYCDDGYEGQTCAVQIVTCAERPCQNMGRCIDRLNGFSCDCRGTRFTGPTCEIPDMIFITDSRE
eukprot:m.25619 g.25619  ORF g.25619 m.25619 type:complete len:168 (+) comp28851_c0_seq1:150-653(+)